MRHTGPHIAKAEELTKRQCANLSQALAQSRGHATTGVNYAMQMSVAVEAAKMHKSTTGTMDWYVPVLAGMFGLYALAHMAYMLTCEIDAPPEVFKAPHLPIHSQHGVYLNACTRPITICHRRRADPRWGSGPLLVCPIHSHALHRNLQIPVCKRGELCVPKQ